MGHVGETFERSLAAEQESLEGMRLAEVRRRHGSDDAQHLRMKSGGET